VAPRRRRAVQDLDASANPVSASVRSSQNSWRLKMFTYITSRPETLTGFVLL